MPNSCIVGFLVFIDQQKNKRPDPWDRMDQVEKNATLKNFLDRRRHQWRRTEVRWGRLKSRLLPQKIGRLEGNGVNQ